MNGRTKARAREERTEKRQNRDQDFAVHPSSLSPPLLPSLLHMSLSLFLSFSRLPSPPSSSLAMVLRSRFSSVQHKRVQRVAWARMAFLCVTQGIQGKALDAQTWHKLENQSLSLLSITFSDHLFSVLSISLLHTAVPLCVTAMLLLFCSMFESMFEEYARRHRLLRTLLVPDRAIRASKRLFIERLCDCS